MTRIKCKTRTWAKKWLDWKCSKVKWYLRVFNNIWFKTSRKLVKTKIRIYCQIWWTAYKYWLQVCRIMWGCFFIYINLDLKYSKMILLSSLLRSGCNGRLFFLNNFNDGFNVKNSFIDYKIIVEGWPPKCSLKMRQCQCTYPHFSSILLCLQLLRGTSILGKVRQVWI